MTVSELKLCPFCGSAAELFCEALMCGVSCVDCSAGVHYVSHNSAVEAIAAWNRRAALVSQGAPEWQPIDENTPKTEGERVLLGWALPGYHVQIGFWSGTYHGLNAWCDDATENDYVPQPTHWKPLDASPNPPSGL